MPIDWTNIYKIRINNPSDAFLKHEIVKLIVVKTLMQRYQNKKQYHVIYTEHKFDGKTADVYHHNLKEDSFICYEIQSNINSQWMHDTTQAYKKLEMDWILIDLNKLSNNIEILNKQVKELVV